MRVATIELWNLTIIYFMHFNSCLHQMQPLLTFGAGRGSSEAGAPFDVLKIPLAGGQKPYALYKVAKAARTRQAMERWSVFKHLLMNGGPPPPDLYEAWDWPSGKFSVVCVYQTTIEQMKATARAPEIWSFDGVHGTCNQKLLALFPANLDGELKINTAGFAYFESESRVCLSALIRGAIPVILGHILFRATHLKVDSGPMFVEACTLAIAEGLYGDNKGSCSVGECLVSAAVVVFVALLQLIQYMLASLVAICT